MRFRSGMRIGQSSSELTLAVVFSFFIHVLLGLASAFLYVTGIPKHHVPLYEPVILVDQVQHLPDIPRLKPKPAPPVEKPLPPKANGSLPKPKAMPDFSDHKPKPVVEQAQEARQEEKQQVPSVKTESVAVTTSQKDFKFSWYLALVREKIGRNWRPPPDAQNAKARVVFRVNRSGWVDAVNLAEQASGTFGFQQAAIRAIRSSNPFPPLPEEFSKLSVEFSVDLMAE
ncbi:MAG: TonB family protein [Nitrospirota bacterium]